MAIDRNLSDDDLKLIQRMRTQIASYHANYSKTPPARSFAFLAEIDERFGTKGDDGGQFRKADVPDLLAGKSEPPW